MKYIPNTFAEYYEAIKLKYKTLERREQIAADNPLAATPEEIVNTPLPAIHRSTPKKVPVILLRIPYKGDGSVCI